MKLHEFIKESSIFQASQMHSHFPCPKVRAAYTCP